MVACVFVSILVHELGHGVAYRYFGVRHVTIVIHMFGGFARADDYLYDRLKRIAVYLSGPAAGFLLLALVYYSNQATGWSRESRLAGLIYRNLYYFNLYWGLFNLLPIYPLDGGRCRANCSRLVNRRRGLEYSLFLSIGCAALLLFHALNIEFRLVPALIEVLHFLPEQFHDAGADGGAAGQQRAGSPSSATERPLW